MINRDKLLEDYKWLKLFPDYIIDGIKADKNGTFRFPSNRIIRYLIDSSRHNELTDLNNIWALYNIESFSRREMMELYMQIGYSLTGFEEVFGGALDEMEEANMKFIDLDYTPAFQVDKMTLDEAIEHSEILSRNYNLLEPCRKEHEELAIWLNELKNQREVLLRYRDALHRIRHDTTDAINDGFADKKMVEYVNNVADEALRPKEFADEKEKLDANWRSMFTTMKRSR